jgi:hypothetical protein
MVGKAGLKASTTGGAPSLYMTSRITNTVRNATGS